MRLMLRFMNPCRGLGSAEVSGAAWSASNDSSGKVATRKLGASDVSCRPGAGSRTGKKEDDSWLWAAAESKVAASPASVNGRIDLINVMAPAQAPAPPYFPGKRPHW